MNFCCNLGCTITQYNHKEVTSSEVYTKSYPRFPKLFCDRSCFVRTGCRSLYLFLGFLFAILIFVQTCFLKWLYKVENAVSWLGAYRNQYSSAQRFQNPMLGTGQGFGYNHALFWCQWLPMDETNLLGWSLNMTSTCLEHKTRIAQAESRMEKKPLFHDVAYAKIDLLACKQYQISWIGCSDTKKKIFQP